jgi:hypothetical protein
MGGMRVLPVGRIGPKRVERVGTHRVRAKRGRDESYSARAEMTGSGVTRRFTIGE